MGREDLQMLVDMRCFALEFCVESDTGRFAERLIADLIEPRVRRLQTMEWSMKMADTDPCIIATNPRDHGVAFPS